MENLICCGVMVSLKYRYSDILIARHLHSITVGQLYHLQSKNLSNSTNRYLKQIILQGLSFWAFEL